MASTRPGRPRSEETHQAILDATQQVLRERGYGGLSLDEIARRAQVGKRTIYRWWNSKGALVAEAFRENAAQRHPDVDTGSLNADLLAYFRILFEESSEPGKKIALRSMMAEAQADGDFAADFAEFIEDRRALVHRMFQRGVARGEVDPDADLDLAVDLLFGLFWYRILAGDRPLDGRLAEELVQRVLRALRI